MMFSGSTPSQNRFPSRGDLARRLPVYGAARPAVKGRIVRIDQDQDVGNQTRSTSPGRCPAGRWP